jgi:DNA polymerase-3 subunit delta'
VKVPPLQDEDIAKTLITNGLEESEAYATSRLADGNWHEAQRLLQQAKNDHAVAFLEWMRYCYLGKGVEIVHWTEKFAMSGRENQKLFLKYGLHFLREVLILQLAGEAMPARLRKDELATAQKMKTVLNWEKIERLSKLFDDCIFYVERNANPKVLFLDASIRAHKIIRAKIS